MTTPTTPVDLDATAALAEAATPGPWTLDDDERDRVVWTAKDSRWVANVGNWSRQNAAIGEADPDHEGMLRNVFEFDTADARYIAALSPDVALALVEAARALPFDPWVWSHRRDRNECYMCLVPEEPHRDGCQWRIASDALRGVPAREEDRS